MSPRAATGCQYLAVGAAGTEFADPEAQWLFVTTGNSTLSMCGIQGDIASIVLGWVFFVPTVYVDGFQVDLTPIGDALVVGDTSGPAFRLRSTHCVSITGRQFVASALDDTEAPMVSTSTAWSCGGVAAPPFSPPPPSPFSRLAPPRPTCQLGSAGFAPETFADPDASYIYASSQVVGTTQTFSACLPSAQSALDVYVLWTDAPARVWADGVEVAPDDSSASYFFVSSGRCIALGRSRIVAAAVLDADGTILLSTDTSWTCTNGLPGVQ